MAIYFVGSSIFLFALQILRSIIYTALDISMYIINQYHTIHIFRGIKNIKLYFRWFITSQSWNSTMKHQSMPDCSFDTGNVKKRRNEVPKRRNFKGWYNCILNEIANINCIYVVCRLGEDLVRHFVLLIWWDAQWSTQLNPENS